LRIKSIAVFKRVLLFTVVIFTVFFKLSNDVFLCPFIYCSGVLCKVNILMAFCKMGMEIRNYLNLLTQKNNLEWKSQKPLFLKAIARGVLRREDC